MAIITNEIVFSVNGGDIDCQNLRKVIGDFVINALHLMLKLILIICVRGVHLSLSKNCNQIMVIPSWASPNVAQHYSSIVLVRRGDNT